MSYRIQVTRSAEREILRLPVQLRNRILQSLDGLFKQPRPNGCKKLRDSENLWRMRIGAYRVIYSIQDEVRLVRVERAAHRSEVYR